MERVRVVITCSKHQTLGTIARAWATRDAGYPASWLLDLRCRDAISAIANHRRAWDCGASMEYAKEG